MRNRIMVSAMLLLSLFALSVTDTFAQDQGDKAKVEKARMERQITKEILSLPYYGVFDAIGYELKDSTVRLNGYVVRPLTKKEAGLAVMDVEGVSEVVNDIKILPPSPSDDRIRVRVYRAIENQGALYRYLLGANPSIRIIVNGGRVTLEGFVTYESDKTLAGFAATEIFGVLNVTNNLKIERRAGEEVS